MACTRLKLKRREKIIFYRLLGFLIRNDKPFPYSIKALKDVTGYSRASLFECLNLLEKCRLIARAGYTNQTKFIKGSILIRICSLVQKRININLNKMPTLVQKLDELPSTSPVSGYHKTSSSLKHKETEFIKQLVQYNEYAQRIKCDRDLGLKSGNVELLKFEDWRQVR